MTLTIFVLIGFLCVLTILRLATGVFIFPPIKELPKGLIIVYWRTNIKLDFKESVDGIIKKAGIESTDLNKRAVYNALYPIINKYKLFTIKYKSLK